MNKKELIHAVTEATGVSVKDTTNVINAMLEIIPKTLAEGDSVQLIGFGNFEVKERAERLGRNPHSGETIIIPASKAPSFKAGKAFKDAVNK